MLSYRRFIPLPHLQQAPCSYHGTKPWLHCRSRLSFHKAQDYRRHLSEGQLQALTFNCQLTWICFWQAHQRGGDCLDFPSQPVSVGLSPLPAIWHVGGYKGSPHRAVEEDEVLVAPVGEQTPYNKVKSGKTQSILASSPGSAPLPRSSENTLPLRFPSPSTWSQALKVHTQGPQRLDIPKRHRARLPQQRVPASAVLLLSRCCSPPPKPQSVLTLAQEQSIFLPPTK